MQMPRKQPWIVFVGLSLAATLPGAASAANNGPYLGFGGTLSLMSPQDALDAGTTVVNNKFHNGFGTDLNLGYAFASGLRPEVEFGYRFNKIKSATSDDLIGDTASGHYQAYTEMLNAWYDFKSSNPDSALSFVHPYIGGGVGVAQVGVRENVGTFGDAVDDKKSLFAYQAGAGIGFDFTRQFTLAFDARWLRTPRGNFSVSNDVIDTLGGAQTLSTRYESITLGMSIRYSFLAAPAPAKAAPTHEDNTITAVPIAQVAAPTTVEQDSDGDGVPDSLDKCPNTPKGFKVNGGGCIVQQTVVLHAVNFQFNSDQLTAPAKDTLDQIAAGMVGQPALKVEIDGHTDSKGSAAYNLKLSQRRADSVKHYLVSKGASADNLSAHGFGMSHPIASNDTDEGRAQNRRVEFVVAGGGETPNTKVTTGDSTDASKAAAEH